MNVNSLHGPGLPRRTLLLGSLGALAACATKPIALDPALMAGVKHVSVPTPGFPAAPRVDVINGMGKQFGLVGLVTTAVVMNNRANAVSDLMKAQAFDPHDYFEQQVADRLHRRGLDVLAQPANAGRQDFLADYATAGTADAALDVYVSTYGFFAYSDSDSSPYRPVVAVNMRLVSLADRSILMQDRVANSSLGASLDKETTPAIPSFPTFGAVTENPALAVAALQSALSYAADAVGARLA